MRMVRQSLAVECGLACLAMVLSHHKVAIELAELRALAPPSSHGTKVRQLVDLAARYGITGRAVRVELDELANLRLPAILHWDFSHFVVLESFKGAGGVIVDPAVGRRKVTARELSDRFTGVAVEFRPSSALTPTRRLVKASLSDFWSSASGLGRSAAVLTVLSITIQILLLISPVVLATLADDAIRLGSRNLALTLGGVMVAIGVLTAGGEALRRSSLVRLGVSLNAQINLNLMRHLLTLGFPFFLHRRLNDLLSRVDSTRAIRDALTEEALPTVVDGVFAACTIVIVVLISPLAGALMALSVFAYFAVKQLTYVASRANAQGTLEALAAERGVLTDTLRGISTVHLLNAQSSRLNAWCGSNLHALNATQRQRDLVVKVAALRSALTAADLALIAVAGVLLVMDAQLTLGGLMALLLYRQQFQDRAFTLVDRAFELRLLGVHLERLSDIVDGEPDRPAPEGRPEALAITEARLEASDLWFRHGDDAPWVLRGAALDVRPGEFLAISGRSGGGKTTLLRILTGLLTPSVGEVRVDGQSVRPANLAALRDSIGVVLQDDQIFSGTILENISAWDVPSDSERVVACAKLACIHDDILRLPMGYHTLLGDMGSSLSGGQRQRLFIARALYRQPRLILLDEGTANLDQELEAAILANLRGLGATIVCIAHRQTAIDLADRVLTLADGQLRQVSDLHTPRLVGEAGGQR